MIKLSDQRKLKVLKRWNREGKQTTKPLKTFLWNRSPMRILEIKALIWKNRRMWLTLGQLTPQSSRFKNKLSWIIACHLERISSWDNKDLFGNKKSCTIRDIFKRNWLIILSEIKLSRNNRKKIWSFLQPRAKRAPLQNLILILKLAPPMILRTLTESTSFLNSLVS
jgi:hypothetical protein